MDAQVHHAAATGLREVIEPRLVGAICVMEDEVRGEDLANRAGARHLHKLWNASHRAIAEVDCQEPVMSACGRERPRSLGRRTRQGLLTKHRVTVLKSG